MATFSIALRNQQLDEHNAKLLLQFSRETDIPTQIVRPGSAPGDEAALRGIPVVGAKGVGGAIAGTRPGAFH